MLLPPLCSTVGGDGQELASDSASASSPSETELISMGVEANLSSARLTQLGDRFLKLPVLLALLSFRIIELADVRIMCSPRLLLIPGYGRRSLVHTSVNPYSMRSRSTRLGARTTARFVVNNDCDRLIEPEAEICESQQFLLCVLRMMTCKLLLLECSVAARRIESRRVRVPGRPKTYPSDLMSNAIIENKAGNVGSSVCTWTSLADNLRRSDLHCSSSRAEQAQRITSYSCWSASKASFQEYGAV